MIRRTFDFVAEPRGDLWKRTLRALSRQASIVTLVLRDDIESSETAQAIIARLEPQLVEKGRSSSWPGTTLIGGEATILRFAASEAVVDALLVAADGLYQWRQPMLPEDLALLRVDGSTVLGSISHECDAFLELTDGEFEALRIDVPELDDLVKAQDT